MKHTNKKRSRPSKKQVGKQPNHVSGGDDYEESLILSNLMEVFASVSLQEAASAYREAGGDPNKAAEILGNMADSSNDRDRAEIVGISVDLTEDRSTTCSSSNFSTGESSSSSGNEEKFGGVCSKPKKKVSAAAGMVSTVLGKDYLSSKTKRLVPIDKWASDDPVCKGDAEQFLCSMMGDDCDLSLAVVRDVLCQCSYDVEKALNVLLELSASPSELPKNDQDFKFSRNTNEDAPVLESSDNLTDRASDSTSHSSESEFQDSVWFMGYNTRSFSEVLTDSGKQPSYGPRSSASELPQEVLKSLFNTPKSSERAPNSMNWRNVVKKMESFGQSLDNTPEDTEEQHFDHAKGEDYQVYRETARQHWDSVKTYYQKAATAYTNGEREYASYLSDQGRLHSKLARQADEKASQNIFNSRNKNIGNMITIDLHGQHVKQAMRLLKLHLIFGAYVRSVRRFRVITGCGSHGLGKSKLKQSVIDLIEREGIGWSEENKGTLLIRLNGQAEFSFLDSESDTE